MQNSQNMFDFLVQFLKEQKSEWVYERYKEDSIITFAMQGHNGIKFQVVIDVKENENENEKVILVYSIFSIYAMEDKKTVASEFINRLNYSLVSGNFEFDFTDGEIRFKSSCNCQGIELSYEFLDNLIMISITTLDNASKWFVDVLLNGVSPEEAYNKFRLENE